MSSSPSTFLISLPPSTSTRSSSPPGPPSSCRVTPTLPSLSHPSSLSLIHIYVVATPGALYRYWRQGQTGGSLTVLLLAGTIPGVVAGSVVRVELLPGPRTFELVIAIVLVPLGSWLATDGRLHEEDAPWLALTTTTVVVLAALVGVILSLIHI